MRFSLVNSEMWTRPSTPSSTSTNAPNLASRVTLPSIIFPVGIAVLERVPWISQNLFQSEAEASGCGIHLEDDSFDALTQLQYIAGTLDAALSRTFPKRGSILPRRAEFRRTRRNPSVELTSPVTRSPGFSFATASSHGSGDICFRPERNLATLLVGLSDLKVEHITDAQF